ncbi:MAG: hypothetical protein ACOX15_05450 [Tepidanaerobacteraceae bacterium]|jgi:Holliday junction resolvase
MKWLYYSISGLTAVVFTLLYLIKYFRTIKAKNRIRKAKRSEKKAIKLLESRGFEIVDIQKENSYKLYVDGKPYEACVKADIIARKGSKYYVAEVKSGEKATSPRYPETRRQLLEYFLVYKPDGLILVDMEKKNLRKIEYAIVKDRNNNISILLKYALIFIIGLVIGFLTRGE